MFYIVNKLLFIIPLLVCLLSSCSNIKHTTLVRDLATTKATSYISGGNIFLDQTTNTNHKKILLKIQNISAIKEEIIKDEIVAALIGIGYTVVDSISNADCILQICLSGPTAKPKSENQHKERYKNRLNDLFAYILPGALIGKLVLNNAINGILGGGVGGLVSCYILKSFLSPKQYIMTCDLVLYQRTSMMVNHTQSIKIPQGTSGAETVVWSNNDQWQKYHTTITAMIHTVRLWQNEIKMLLQSTIQTTISIF